MKRALATALPALLAALAGSAASGSELLPRPAGLEPNVQFWTRIYTEVDGDAGLIHDSEHLDVVYETIRFRPGASSRSRERATERAKTHIRAVLRELASGKRSGLSADAARILALWPPGVTNKTLRNASHHVRFQLGQANKFRDGLVRAGAWRAFILQNLRDAGVPEELVALPHVESSYNPKAYSRVGAAGLWQFTRSTGRRYLRVDHVVDERMDPFEATQGAARLLSDNYRRLRAWPLAITAYNHGVAGMSRAVRKLGTRDMATISRRYKSRTFGFASRNFYAEFLAAMQIDQNPERYFGTLRPDSPIEYTRVELPHYYGVDSLERALGLSRATLRQHNPALRPSVWNGAKRAPRGFALRVPAGAVAQPLEVALASVPPAERFAVQHRDKYYKVRRGDALSTIARRYGVRVSELVALNNLRSRNRIRAGQVLILPDDAAGGGVQVARATPPADGIYRVRRGDTLSTIARRFGVSETQLARENGLRNRNRLYVGQELRLPGYAPSVVAGTPAAAVAPAPAEPTPAPEVASATEVIVADASPARPEDAVVPPSPAPEPEPAESQPPLAPAPSVELPEEPEPLVVVSRVEPRATEPPAAEPSATEPAATEAPAAAETSAASAPPADPSNYAVTGSGRIVVQADETLGHYADWLEVRASDLRSLNRMRYGTPLVIGRSLKLDFRRVTPETFEQRRLAYHQALQEEFFDSYTVTGTSTHVLRRGESLWYLAERKFRIPVWLLRQYNPDLDFGSLPVGARMVVPEVEPRAT